MTDDDDKDGFRRIVQSFVGGMRDAIDDVPFDERTKIEAEIAAALFDEAIAICFERGITKSALLLNLGEHIAEVAAARAAALAREGN